MQMLINAFTMGENLSLEHHTKNSFNSIQVSKTISQLSMENSQIGFALKIFAFNLRAEISKSLMIASNLKLKISTGRVFACSLH